MYSTAHSWRTDTARKTLFPPFWMLWQHIGRTWCGCRDMAWSEQRPDKFRMYVNKLCGDTCLSDHVRPSQHDRKNIHTSQPNCLKLSGHTGRHDRSRQDVVYLYKMCAQNACTCPAIPAVAADQNNLSGQAVPQAHQGFCSGHVVPLLCRVVSTSRDTDVTNELYCTVSPRINVGALKLQVLVMF